MREQSSAAAKRKSLNLLLAKKRIKFFWMPVCAGMTRTQKNKKDRKKQKQKKIKKKKKIGKNQNKKIEKNLRTK